MILEEGNDELEGDMKCIVCRKELQTSNESFSEIVTCFSASSETKLSDLIEDLVNPVHSINFAVNIDINLSVLTNFLALLWQFICCNLRHSKSLLEWYSRDVFKYSSKFPFQELWN